MVSSMSSSSLRTRSSTAATGLACCFNRGCGATRMFKIAMTTGASGLSCDNPSI